jgi:hypothetical protein
VQEPDIGLEAYNAIAAAVNTHRKVFPLGFAWGGRNGRVVDLKSDGFFASDAKGEAAQRWLKSSRFGWFVDEVSFTLLTPSADEMRRWGAFTSVLTRRVQIPGFITQASEHVGDRVKAAVGPKLAKLGEL